MSLAFGRRHHTRTAARAIEGSLAFAAFESGRQIGFARVITDRATFA